MPKPRKRRARHRFGAGSFDFSFCTGGITLKGSKCVFIAGAIGAMLFMPAQAALLPMRVGACVATTIKSVETRLMDASTGKPIPDSGSAVSFTNGGYQVSYDTVPAIERSQSGDPVRMCLVSIRTGCPKGDNRGRIYRKTNLRTHQSWRLPDAEHSCGGA